MVNNISKNKNLDLIRNIEGIKQIKYPIFKVRDLLIYTPAIQSNESRALEGFDINWDVMNNILNHEGDLLIVIRYFNDFIILKKNELNLFIEQSTRQSNDMSRWSFKLKDIDGKKLISLTKSKYEIPVSVLNKEEIMELMKREFLLTFNKSTDIKIDNVENSMSSISVFNKSKGFQFSLENIINFYLSLWIYVKSLDTFCLSFFFGQHPEWIVPHPK